MYPVPAEENQVIPHVEDAIKLGVISPEIEKYVHCVCDIEISEQQKREFLLVLWRLMSSFVDLGFGADSVMEVLMQRAVECPTGSVMANASINKSLVVNKRSEQ